MMTCRDVLNLVTEYLEDGLPLPDRMRFERHIAICPPCRGYIGQMRETLRVAGALDEEELSATTRHALLDAFRDWRSHR